MGKARNATRIFSPRIKERSQVVDTMGGSETITYAGQCIGCNTDVFNAQDPRGPTGPRHYNNGIEITHEGKRHTFPACWTCCESSGTYDRAAANARRKLDAGG